jgi:methionyl-tRNA formyltransferase
MKTFRICAKCALRISVRREEPWKNEFRRTYSIDVAPPKILYFGTDSFSVTALGKLVTHKVEEPSLYKSIYVVTREPRPQGRGLEIKKCTFTVGHHANPAAVHTFAEENDIPFMHVNKDTIQTMNTKRFDLIIAVSFGLFIPPKTITSVPSTINVHPSLLPQYRGPAPIQHAWLNGDAHTGVTLQTLSPTSFDKGIIFDQSFPVELVQYKTFRDLCAGLAHLSAEMLLTSLRKRSYLSPSPVETFTKESYAPIVSDYIDWTTATDEHALRLAGICNPKTGAISRASGKRTIISVRDFRLRAQNATGPPGSYFLARHGPSGDILMCVTCANKRAVFVEQVKVSGKHWVSSRQFVESAELRFWGNRFVPRRKEFDEHDPSEFA